MNIRHIQVLSEAEEDLINGRLFYEDQEIKNQEIEEKRQEQMRFAGL